MDDVMEVKHLIYYKAPGILLLERLYFLALASGWA